MFMLDDGPQKTFIVQKDKNQNSANKIKIQRFGCVA
ncbi:hypothetical protein SMB34_21390 [Thalassospira permensis NBRC 106175]|uniref:Uncharacterized protein n=1 Tax=Thalassospira permensis NBRC 106175 TaxID=1353532 RepID=A0ABR4TJX3_9PROT|nr:hypothetical protein SMB34_21390 [Thalassospira permensis NBRC 106175]